ncbi:non-ribosomal peptide synthetase [Pseudoalteromonas sp. OOF1S-7]|uniref:non-ribosomal peptide synthetase n=1 Tax=Pseudoalteromonas sp. OOF1S-7 TaxID=2917757 RepID=UPI001EF47705|nr:non-ribosomal peptide synthetase [Pseudoalteromonas sp. OOF1S-7]MCG7534496.1 amino acid adenylation domain-containing protein [Pseudoalteromonas sp. OOF1S-7]
MNDNQINKSSGLLSNSAKLSAEKKKLLQMRLQGKVKKNKNAISTRDKQLNILPLSATQRRLWVVDQLEKTGTQSAYNISGGLEINGELNIDALRQALNHMVARHESLRTTFSKDADGNGVQIINDDSAFELLFTDVSGQADKHTEIKQIALNEAKASFDLAKGPLLRTRLIKSGEDSYVFVYTFHHIISDAWSLSVFCTELLALYQQYQTSGVATLPPLPVQYGDFALWQNKQLNDYPQQYRDKVDFWKKHLSGAPDLLALPTDYSRPAAQSFKGSVLPLTIDSALRSKLIRLNQSHNLTMFMTLFAGWAILLAKLTQQDDLVIGMSSANRGQQDIEGLIGFFVNTFALRPDLTSSQHISEFLKQVRQLLLDGYAHQDAAFEDVVEAVNPARSLSHSTLFQTMIVLVNTPLDNSAEQAMGLSPYPISSGGEKYDVTLVLNDTGSEVTGHFSYATDLFKADTIVRWRDYFHRVLHALCDSANQTLAQLNILPGDETARLLTQYNDTSCELPEPAALVHQLFEQQVALHPAQIALQFADTQISNTQLNEMANRLAHYLREQGVGRETIVAIYMERSIDVVVAILATMKAGGAYLMLDPEHPEQRITALLDDARPGLILTQQDLKENLPESACPKVQVDSEGAFDAYSAANLSLLPGASIDDLAYVIYTSGSTGLPKGVMVEHSALRNHLHWIQDTYPLHHDDAVLQKTAFSFDVSVWEVWWPLTTDARLVMAIPGGQRDPDYLLDAIAQHQISHIHFVPSMLSVLLEHPSWTNCVSLKRVFSGGEELSVSLQNQFFSTNMQADLVNFYGPAETTIEVASWVCQRDAQEGEASDILRVPLGYPVHNCQLYVLDQNQKPVATGVTGELYIAGKCLSRGYLNNAELTAQRFIANPFSDDISARMYRTGDRVRFNENGQIEYLGRNDVQFKIRGIRIEPGEIEAALKAQTNVHLALVTCREVSQGDKQLLAYVIPASGQQIDIEALKRQLSVSLPEFMIPAYIMTLDAWPLTVNGKIDVKALPLPQDDGSIACAEQAPQGEIETFLATIWCDLLGIEQPGRNESFFELGGHSLSAVRFLTSIKQQKGWSLTLKDLFACPTIQQLAQLIPDEQEAAAMPVAKVDRSQPIPLSLAQHRLWLIDQMGQTNSAYNLGGSFRLRGELEPVLLQQALTAIQDKHEILRTRFVKADSGEACQVIEPAGSLQLDVWELLTEDDATRFEQIREKVAITLNAPFDLEQGPLVRASLLKLPEQSWVLTLAMHHIVSDGWSTNILLNDLITSYRQCAQGQSGALQPMPLQYADYAQWQRDECQGGKIAESLDYWQQNLTGALPLLELPYDKSRPAVQSFKGDIHKFQLDNALVSQLEQLAKSHNMSLFMVLYAGWSILMAKLSGQSDIVTGVPVSNRERVEFETIIGFFVNTIALRAEVNDTDTITAFLQHVKQVAISGYEHQSAPFEKVVEQVQPQRSMSFTPVFQTMISLLNTPNDVAGMPGVEVQPNTLPVASSQFDLILAMQEFDGVVNCGLTFATDLFEAQTIQQWAQYYINVLQTICRDTQVPLAEMSLLDSQQQHALLDVLSGPSSKATQQDTALHLFDSQVVQRPDSLALTCGSVSLSYDELNKRANQLARYLGKQGVGNEKVVGVLLDRGIDMIVSIMAILKAGGAFMPLDPQYPKERIRFMVQNSQPVLVIAQGAYVPELRDAGVTCFDPDADWAVVASESTGNLVLDQPITPASLAYVMYTSGSTGEPKGAMLEHGNLYNLMDDFADIAHSPSEQNAMWWAASSFDASVYEIFTALCFGMNLHIVEDDVRFDPTLLFNWMADTAIHFAYIPPFYVQPLHKRLAESGDLQLRHIMVGVEPIPHDTLLGMKRCLPDLNIVNAYGPTEAAVYCARHVISQESRQSNKPAPIGTAVKNTQLYVLSHDQQPVPKGVVGELYVAGKSVARGYDNNVPMSERHFVCIPSLAPGLRLYRTGDMVRLTNDDLLEYVGRNDEQVKIRGVRIELGELQGQLKALPEVENCVIKLIADTQGQKRIIAYVEPVAEFYQQQSDEQLESILKTKLAKHLPVYLMPSGWVVMSRLPRLPNGKIDRATLPEYQFQYTERPYKEAVTETQKQLQRIWCQLLNKAEDHVAIDVSMFELGGHSLLMLKLRSIVQEQMEVQLDVRQIFENPNIEDIAVLIDRAKRQQTLQMQIENTQDSELEIMEF